jgi:hypothetical protein
MAKVVRIQNSVVRRDVNDDPIDCHDGCLRYFAGRFYLYGTQYGSTDGFNFGNRYVVYSSADMERWVPHGLLLEQAPPGVYYRPYVIYNARTCKYVLWYNWYPKLWEGQFASAVSDSPFGPFTVVHEKITLRGEAPGDHNLFVDDDGTGYVVYTDIKGLGHDRHAMSVERLASDYLTSTGEGSDAIDHRVEAPAMFKRNGLYYVVFGQTCCFCPEGADARVFVSEHPLGPYRRIGDINRDEAGKIIIPGQQTDIAIVPTRNGDAYLWMADLWGSRADGVKGHDLQYWSAPLEFDAGGAIHRLRRHDAFDLELCESVVTAETRA